MITALDHIQLPMPEGREGDARDFFGRLLELEEVDKPPSLARRGGVWFALPDGRQVHLGVEESFRPNQKVHPACACAALDGLALRLGEGDIRCGGTEGWRPAAGSIPRTLSETGWSSSNRLRRQLESFGPAHRIIRWDNAESWRFQVWASL